MCALFIPSSLLLFFPPLHSVSLIFDVTLRGTHASDFANDWPMELFPFSFYRTLALST